MQIPRSLIRHLRAVFRRLVRKPFFGSATVSFHSDRTGLRVRLHETEVLAEFHHAGLPLCRKEDGHVACGHLGPVGRPIGPAQR